MPITVQSALLARDKELALHQDIKIRTRVKDGAHVHMAIPPPSGSPKRPAPNVFRRNVANAGSGLAKCSDTASWLTTNLPSSPKETLRWWQNGAYAALPAENRVADGRLGKRPQPAQTVVAGSQLDHDILEAGISHREFHECLERYNRYVDEGVPMDSIVEFNPVWRLNIDRLLDIDAFSATLPSHYVACRVAEMHREIEQDYARAAKRAIVDRRMIIGVPFVPIPPVIWGAAHFVGVEGTHGGPPESWRKTLNASKEQLVGTLASCSWSSLRLLDLWNRDFDSLLLVDLPPPSSSDMLELSAFCSAQSRHCAGVRHLFEGRWLRSVADILGASGAKPGGVPTFIDAVCALLSTQVRSVVDRSIEVYVDFFRRFANDARGVIPNHRDDDREDAFLKVGVTAKFGDVRFTTPLAEIKEALLRIFEEFVVSLHGLERPGGKSETKDTPERPYLWEVSLEEQHVQEAREFIEGVIRLNLSNVEDSLVFYNEYKHLLTEDARVRQLSENLTLTREDYMCEVEKLRATEAAIRERCPHEIRLQMVCIDCAEINETLCQKATEAVHILLGAALRNLLLKNDHIVRNFETVVNQMVKKPTSELELADLEAHVEEFRSHGLRGLLDDFDNIQAWLRFLFDCETRLCRAMLSQRHFQAIYDSAVWVHSIDQIVSEREANLRREREALESKFKEQRNKFVEDLEGFNTAVDKFRDNGNLRLVDDYLERLKVLRSQFSRARAEAEKMNMKEERLGWKPSSFEQLRHGEQALEPYFWIWTLAFNLDRSMKLWQKGILFALNPEKVDKDVRMMLREAKKLHDIFTELGQPTQCNVATQIETQLNVMLTSQVELVHALCNLSLRTRHWEEISLIVGFTIEPDSLFTLSRIVELDVGRHVKKLQEISKSATKEYSIETVLDSMEEEWATVQFQLVPWVNSDTCVIASSCVSDMRQLVDDHLARTRVMRCSPHVTPWAERVAALEGRLDYIDQALQCWVRLQSSWVYLRPVFQSEEKVRQMPTEGQLFGSVDKVWRQLMQQTNTHPSAKDVFASDDLVERLTECCGKLEKVKRGLADHLEIKRLVFPRFHFISNEELLEIVVDSSETRRIHRHWRRCFPGIAELTELSGDQSGQELDWDCAISDTGETLPFGCPLDMVVVTSRSTEKSFEHVEKAIMTAVRHTCLEALQVRTWKDKVSWASSLPQQSLVTAQWVLWTKEASSAIEANSLPALGQQYDREVHEWGRVAHKCIHSSDRIRAEALTLATLHGREILLELQESGITNLEEFGWQRLILYYIEEKGLGQDALEGRLCEIVMNIGALRFQCGYEYHPSGPHIVMTKSLTCIFHVVAEAFRLQFGAMIHGPSDCGKSVTVQHIARCALKLFAAVDCISSFDSSTILRVLRGMSSCGAWCCLDNLDNLSLSVLSITAQHLLTIQQALVGQVDKFSMDNQTQTILPCSIMACVSGRPGRSALPETLKALFRPVYLTRPDLRVVAEAKLRSFGFANASELALKLDCFYKAYADTFVTSPFRHNGFISALSVLSATQTLQQQLWTSESEFCTLSRIITENERPKLNAEEAGILQDLLKSILPDGPSEHHPNRHIRAVFRDTLDEKALQCLDVALHSRGLIAIGEPMTGKTHALVNLARALSTGITERGFERPAVRMATICPNALGESEFTGSFRQADDETGRDWVDGILPVILRSLDSANSEWFWVHLDGRIDPAWSETLTSTLLEQGRISLANGETLHVPANTLLAFESDKIDSASPAWVSRCSVVHFDSDADSVRYIEVWLQSGPGSYYVSQENYDVVLELLCAIFLPLARFAASNLSIPLESAEQCLIANALSMLAELLGDPQARREGDQGENIVDSNEVLAACRAARIISACTLGFGTVVIDTARQEFDRKLRKLISLRKASGGSFAAFSTPLPTTGSCFEWFWDDIQGAWVQCRDVSGTDLKTASGDIFVLTPASLCCLKVVQTCAASQRHVAVGGTLGCGKTSVLNAAFHELNMKKHIKFTLSLHGNTKASDLRAALSVCLERRERGNLGPPVGVSCGVIIDDLNLPFAAPAANRRTGQPSELLRQFCAYGGWHDCSHADFEPVALRCVQDTFFLVGVEHCAGFGSAGFPTRCLRQFQITSLPPLETNQLIDIFAYKLGKVFEPVICAKLSSLTAALLGRVQSISKLTPMVPQMKFSVHDASRVITGVLRNEDNSDIVDLWSHECLRVFADRFPTEEEQITVERIVQEVAVEGFGIDPARVANVAQLIYVNGPVPFQSEASYRKIQAGTIDVLSWLEEHVEECSQDVRIQKLLTIPSAAMHVVRIMRGMQFSGGSALLTGHPQRGRRSLAKMAALASGIPHQDSEHMADSGSAAWRQEFKATLWGSAKSLEATMLLISLPNGMDFESKRDLMFSDVHELITCGGNPDFWTEEERVGITELLEKNGLNVKKARLSILPPTSRSTVAVAFSPEEDIVSPAEDHDLRQARTSEAELSSGWSQVHAAFAERCRVNTRVVLCACANSDLTDLLRRFPAYLTSADVVDWVAGPSVEALEGLAIRYADNVDENTAALMVRVREISLDVADDLSRRLRRDHRASLNCFYDFVKTYSVACSGRAREVKERCDHYSEALSQCKRLREALQGIQLRAAQCDEELAKFKEDTEGVKKNVVAFEESATTAKMNLVEGETSLDKKTKKAKMKRQQTMEAIEESVKTSTSALDKLEEEGDDLSDIRAMRVPSPAAKKILEAVGLLKGFKMVRMRDEGTSASSACEQWLGMQKMVCEVGFIASLRKVGKEKISTETANRVSRIIIDEDCEVSKVAKQSNILHKLLIWVKSVAEKPELQKKQEEAQSCVDSLDADYVEMSVRTAETQEQLQNIEEQVLSCTAEIEERMRKGNEINKRRKKLHEAVARWGSVIESIDLYTSSWSSVVAVTCENGTRVPGTSLLAAAMLTHLGSFPHEIRHNGLKACCALLERNGVLFDQKLDILKALGSESRKPRRLGLDSSVVENAIIAMQSRRVPLCIDPQGFATRWLIDQSGVFECSACSGSHRDLIETAFESGRIVILLDVEAISRSTEGLLRLLQNREAANAENQTTTVTSQQLYLITRIANPRFPSSIWSNVSTVDFTPTDEVIADKLFNAMLRIEDVPTVCEAAAAESERAAKFQSAENELLLLLRRADFVEPPLDADERLEKIEVAVRMVKQASGPNPDVSQYQQSSTYETQAVHCLPVRVRRASAARVAQMFAKFLVMHSVSPTYVFALGSAEKAIREGNKWINESGPRTGGALTNYARNVLIRDLCPAICSYHRLLVLTLLSLEQASAEGKLDPKECELLFGSIVQAGTVEDLTALPQFQGLTESLRDESAEWGKVDNYPIIADEVFPGKFANLTRFQKLLIIRRLWPARFVSALSAWVKDCLGHESVTAPESHMHNALKNSAPSKLVFLLLAPGTSPAVTLAKLAHDCQQDLCALAIGAGRGPRAERLVEAAFAAERWVLLQDCHLDQPWFTCFVSTLSETLRNCHKGFRLWLSFEPFLEFPTRILCSVPKVYCEPPVNLKANIKSICAADPLCDEFFYDSCPVQEIVWKHTLCGLLLFHGIVVARRKFGAIGWSGSGRFFSDSDAMLLFQKLHECFQTNVLSAPALVQRLVIDDLYGPQVGGHDDQMLLQTLLSDVCGVSPLPHGAWDVCSLLLGGNGLMAPVANLNDFVDMFPEQVPTAALGLPNCVSVRSQQFEADNLLLGFTACFGDAAIATCVNDSWQAATVIAEEILGALPRPISNRYISSIGRDNMADPSVTALRRETGSYNKLLAGIRDSLAYFDDTHGGRIWPPPCETEEFVTSLVANAIPAAWLYLSYLAPADKPLRSYMADLRARVLFVQEYVNTGPPPIIWLPGFFHMSSFLAALLWQAAEKILIPMERMKLTIRVADTDASAQQRPQDGNFSVLIRGFFIEGGRWTDGVGLEECACQALRSDAPVLCVRARPAAEQGPSAGASTRYFDCPVYRLPCRNTFVSDPLNILFRVPLFSTADPKTWVCRGVALLSQLEV